jgi:hypothetical protein
MSFIYKSTHGAISNDCDTFVLEDSCTFWLRSSAKRKSSKTIKESTAPTGWWKSSDVEGGEEALGENEEAGEEGRALIG